MATTSGSPEGEIAAMSTPIAQRHDRSLRPITGLAVVLLLLGASRPAAAGGFAAGATTNFTTTAGPRTVLLGDVNNDGIPDMIANGAGGSGVSVFRGLGGGTFAAAQTFAANAAGVPALGDFNLDGKLDIAIPLTALQSIQIYNGNGDGTFTSGAVFGIPPNCEVLVSADFNGDGKADLATAGNSTASTGTLRVYLNTTSTPGPIVNMAGADYAVAAQPRGVAVGWNLFGTQKYDLVTANQSAGSVTLMKNNGAGVFGNRLDIATQKSCYAVTVGLLWAEITPGDSRPQIVTANKDSATVSMIAFDPTTSTWSSQKFATAADPRFVSLGDTDGNGNLDVVVSAYNSNVVSILSPNFDGTSNWLKPHVDIAAGSHPWAARVVNFDGDPKPDLLVCVNGNNRISWIHGAPKRGWALGDTIPAFSAKDQYDQTCSAANLAGKWTLLDLCSVWCPPCNFMAKTTERTWLTWYRHPAVPFEYVTALDDGLVHGTASTRDDAINWSYKYGIFRPVLHSSDLPGAGVHAFAVDAETYWTPTLRLIDPSGRVVWLNFGAADDTTIARVVANAAGVAIPLTESASLLSGTETITSGAQQVSSPSNSEYDFTFLFDVTGFGENFTSNFLMTRHPQTLTEDWYVDLVYWPLDSNHLAIPTASDWQITLSNLQLDPGTRSLPPGMTATVVATDTFGVEHTLPAPVSVSWTGGTLTLGAIPAASLAALPPLRSLALSLTMNLSGWVAGVDDGPISAELAMRTPSPNPARSTSRIAWSQPRAGAARLDVYDVGGRHVRTLHDGFVPSGAHAESWNLTDESGARVGAGLYFARLAVAGEPARTQRITVVR
jgi:hypothetical protein